MSSKDAVASFLQLKLEDCLASIYRWMFLRSSADRNRRRACSRRNLSLPGLPQTPRRGFHTFAVFSADTVRVTGETRTFKTRSFCPTCGSSLFDRFGDEFELHIGCLDAPNQLQPTYESWMTRREAWLPPFDVANRYDHDRN